MSTRVCHEKKLVIQQLVAGWKNIIQYIVELYISLKLYCSHMNMHVYL